MKIVIQQKIEARQRARIRYALQKIAERTNETTGELRGDTITVLSGVDAGDEDNGEVNAAHRLARRLMLASGRTFQYCVCQNA